jgi:hypothetical protein
MGSYEVTVIETRTKIVTVRSDDADSAKAEALNQFDDCYCGGRHTKEAVDVVYAADRHYRRNAPTSVTLEIPL